MPKASTWGESFNAGEWSPRMRARISLEKYNSACQRLDNFLPLVQGPACKRSGFRFVRSIKTETKDAILVPFEFSNTQAYNLEFGDLHMRVYKDEAQVLENALSITGVTNATPAVVTTATHGWTTGDEIFVTGTGIAAFDNRYWNIIVLSSTTFSLTGSTASGTSSSGSASRVYEIVTPYASTEVESLSWSQSADVLYIAHPNHPPAKLTRTDHNAWTLSVIAFDYVPFAPENENESDFMAASAGTGTVTITSSSGQFTSDMVGTYVKIREILEAFNPEWKANQTETETNGWSTDRYEAFQANTTTWEPGDRVRSDGKVYSLSAQHSNTFTGPNAPIHDSGYASDGAWDWQFINYGFGYALITVVTDAYRATATVVKEYPKSTISADKTVVSMSTANPIVVTVTAHGWETGDKVFFRGITGTFGTLVNNTLRTITRTAANTFTIPLNGAGLAGGAGSALRMDVSLNANGANAVYPSLWRWSFSAFSAARGYPRAVTFSEDRLVWAATDSDPQTKWFSRSGRYEDHRATDKDDSAMVITLNSSTVNVITWIEDQGGVLRTGTVGGEWSSSKSDEPLTPSNVAARIKQRSAYGSREGVLPATVEDVVLFTSRAGRKLHELVPGSELDDASQYPDLTVLAAHATTGLIKELAFQSEPDRILWALMEDGSLWGMTYDRAQTVVAWHRVTIGGSGVSVKSISVIPAPSGDREQLWAIIQRTINGSPHRYVEILDPTWEEGTPISDAFFVDSGITYSGASVTTIGNLQHLEGQSVEVLVGGISVGPKTVTSGQITGLTATTKAQIGLGYSAVLQPMRPEAGGGDGPAQGKTKRHTHFVVRMDETGRGLYYGPTISRARTELIGLEDAQEMTDGELFTGDSRPQAWPGGYSQEGRVVLKHTSPLPCTILGISLSTQTQD